MTYEEFKDKFVEHIEGRAANERHRGDDSEEDGPPEPTSKEGGKGADLKKSSAMDVSGRGSSQA